MITNEFCGKLFTAGEVPMATSPTEREWKFGFLRRWFPLFLGIWDAVAIVGIFFVATSLRDGSVSLEKFHPAILAVTVGATVFGVYLIGGYSYRTVTNSARFISEHIVVSIFTAIIAVSLVYAFVSFGTGVTASRSSVAATLLLFPLFSVGYRYRLEKVKIRRRRDRAICIVGSTPESLDLIRSIRRSGFQQEIFVFGNPDSNPASAGFESMRVVWLPLSIFDPELPMVRGKRVEHIILAEEPESLPKGLAKKLIRSHCARNHVVPLEAFVLREFKYVPIHLVSPSWVFGGGSLNSANIMVYDRAKRLADAAACALGLLLLSPLLLLTALAVKLTSRGSAFYCQERIGRYEKPFTLFKFRTMVEGADKRGDYTQTNDSRLTPIGGFLRKSRLDELPQLFNVLRGDMSLIGPRPEWSKLVEHYESEIELYHFRHMVRPGITGWAQVNYPYGANLDDTINKLKYDLYYVRYFSLVQDIVIVVKTAYTMLWGRGR